MPPAARPSSGPRPRATRAALPTASAGLASLLAVAGTGRLHDLACRVRAGHPLVPGLRSWSSDYTRGLEQGASALRRRRP
ncbi:MAG TPA: hypothetical protein VF661_03315 [Actinomycetales bacterium]|jgi:hypothetical protein